MKTLSDAKKSVLGNMIIRQTMGGVRKEDKIRDKDELIERINEECKKQNSIETHELNLTMLDVSLVEDMSELFLGFNYLKSIDVSEWNVCNVENMEYMFYMCMSLDDIDVSKWDVSNVKDMYGMFYKCSSLESIDVSKWDVNNVKDMCCMFYGCNFDYIKKENKLIDIWRIWTV